MSEQRKTELEEIIATARQELNEINDADSFERGKELVGRCFKYRNSYSCPEGVDDYWYLYIRVLSARPTGLTMLKFQKDKNGLIMVESDHTGSYYQFTGRYEAISVQEFLREWAHLLVGLQNTNTKAERP